MRVLITLLCLASPVHAQDWFMRDGDEVLQGAALLDRVRGQLLTFFDDGQARFYEDDRYSYSYDGGHGGTAYGHYKLGEDGDLCIDFVNGASRCDRYVVNAGRLILVTENHLRFPVRDESPAPVE